MTPFLILKIISIIIIYLFLLGGTLALNELHFDSEEQRQLNELLFKGSSASPVPKIVGLAEFLTSAIPILNILFELLFDRYSKLPNLTNSVDGRTDKLYIININIDNI